MSLKKFLLYSLFIFLVPVWSWALPEKYYEIIEKNPFSDSRKYVPSSITEAGSSSTSFKQEEIKKNLILRGTMYFNGRSFAILEIRPFFQKKFALDKRKVVLPLGGRLGGCTLEEIKRGEVILGGDCGGVKLSLAEDPERARPLPKSSSIDLPSKQVPKSPLITTSSKTTHPPQVLSPKSTVPKAGLSSEKKIKQSSQFPSPPSAHTPPHFINPFLKLLKSKRPSKRN